ncbi:MAG: DUF502 domain-containing protein [Chloroflexi bacterium]|nr:DUF502 domain-containing protein [Chloroflexota bacterium]
MENVTTRVTVASQIVDNLRDHFIRGLVVVVPLAITWVILSWLFNLVDGILEPLVYAVSGRSFPGVGIVAMAALIYLLGVITFFLPARKTVEGGLSILLKAPLIKDIYGVSSQVLSTMATTDETPFKRVVLVDYPRQGIKSLGFVTGRIEKNGGPKDWVFVFMPSTPNPTVGNMIVVPADQVTETDMSVETALKTLMSGGVMVPKALKP